MNIISMHAHGFKLLFAVCFIFCLQCVLYFVCSVFYILFAVCFIFCLQRVLYFVCSVLYFICRLFCLQCVLYFISLFAALYLYVCSKSHSVCYNSLLFAIFTLLTVVSLLGHRSFGIAMTIYVCRFPSFRTKI
jgi:hypothetical protein